MLARLLRLLTILNDLLSTHTTALKTLAIPSLLARCWMTTTLVTWLYVLATQ